MYGFFNSKRIVLYDTLIQQVLPVNCCFIGISNICSIALSEVICFSRRNVVTMVVTDDRAFASINDLCPYVIKVKRFDADQMTKFAV